MIADQLEEILDTAETLTDRFASALSRVFESPNVSDSNFEPANIVDALDRHANAIFRLAEAIEKAAGVEAPE